MPILKAKENKVWNWNDEISIEELKNACKDFTFLDDGTYEFTFADFEIEDWKGSAKLPPCKRLKVKLQFDCLKDETSSEIQTNYIYEYIPICEKMKWKLEQFSNCINSPNRGQTVTKQWLDDAKGFKGVATVKENQYEGRDGVMVKNNRVDKFLKSQENQAF